MGKIFVLKLYHSIYILLRYIGFHQIPRYIYIGDTTEKVFELSPEIFNYEAIIVECTFLYDDDLERAAETKHCHWKTLRPIIESHPSNTFVLYHFR